ncbi:hypothetical protein NEOLI_001209 [Neolecta irregularis DAH-3]|uniref:Uncharacterized protein n=1 Tax=Neolecta irregularis (strain DAH-3) TaxID=1198029 RepID=A0A1U7LU38_NEOID|nr:hypothetical protein NEOLI_001209 [Neolecta irregularis DAH-3]|eukprot:OLL26177.1 hypothetical protein NEOLI_001209 [Neolecta irregularis DAH-3]
MLSPTENLTSSLSLFAAVPGIVGLVATILSFGHKQLFQHVMLETVTLCFFALSVIFNLAHYRELSRFLPTLVRHFQVKLLTVIPLFIIILVSTISTVPRGTRNILEWTAALGVALYLAEFIWDLRVHRTAGMIGMEKLLLEKNILGYG